MVRKVTQLDDLHTLRSFRNASSALDSLYGQFAKACGLSVNEYWSLVLIGEGARTQSEICKKLYLSRQTINSAFKLLQKKQLVELIPDPHNQRIKHTVLTERGHQLYDTHIMKMRHWEEHAWKSMDEQERIMLSELTWKLYHLIEELYLREENEK